MFSSIGRWRRGLATVTGILLIVSMVAVDLSLSTAPAGADTAPVTPGEPETVSAAALPTVQINGVVWAQVIVGNRVYATGEFTQARPAGAALGVNETPRTNILAYDITTGELIQSWAPSLNAPGLAIAASADGSTIYVGGDFDQVNGQWRSRIAAIDAQTGAVLPFNPGANTTVRAIAAASSGTVYFGGFFTSVGNNEIGFTNRSRLAAVDASGALLPWAPVTDREVVAMIVHPASGRVIVGGSFNTLNGVQARGSGSVDGVSGASMPWAANQTIQNYGDGVEVGSFTTDGTQIFGSGWTFLSGGGVGNLEGVFAADAMTGTINWINATRGDNYSIAYANDVVYSVGHTHDAGMIGWNPQTPDPWQFQRTNAMSSHVSPTLTNAYGTNDLWDYFPGFKAAQPLHWMPTLTGGTYTGQGQAAWSVATNGDYVVQGGEFPRVNNVPQQGLVRFAKRTIAPTVDLIQNYTELTPTLTAAGPGAVRIAWQAAWDRDNARIKVEVLRGESTATATVLKTFETNGTTWWNRPPLAFYDTTAPAGSSQTYRIRVTDPYGDGYAGPPATVTIPAGTPAASQYTDAVLADSPSWEWRLGETSGTAARDRSGSNDLTLNNSVQRNQTSALLNEPTDRGVNFPGTTSTSTVQGASPFWQLGPQTFSLEAWVNTTTSNGGKIIGFGDSRTGRSDSNNVDRHIYMTNAGQIRFGVRPDMGTRQTIQSSSNYRDGQWHHVVGTLDGSGMKLYVDGNLVASNAAVTKAQVYQGYWRVGGDRLTSWPSAPNREAIAARIDEVAVYPTALSLGRIRAHYLASGRTTSFPNILPTAAFTSTNQFVTASFDGSASADDDGTISSYQWSFGDSTTGTGATPEHIYAVAGTYDVSLTVTDDRGGTNTITKPVTVVDPPPNVPPVAAFSSSALFHTATVTSTSNDPDGGGIVSSEWTFGDGGTGSGVTADHTYATAGTYDVTLTVTDNRGGITSVTRPVTITDQYASDAFDRTESNGLGTADQGGPWTLSGAASDFAVAGGAGRITSAANQSRAGYLTSVHQTDVDMKSVVSLTAPATGGGAYVSLIGRRVSNGNDYRLKLRYLAGGGIAAYLTRTLGGVETIPASITVPGLSVNPGDGLRTRFQVLGSGPTTIRAKVWREGTQEPGTWLLATTDATPPVLEGPGDVGMLLYTSGSWTGAAPTLVFDDFIAEPDSGAPQNVPPVASFTSTVSHLTASFDSSASVDPDFGTITSRAWDFGDSTFGSGDSPTHPYSAPGTYSVTLTVTDNNGATNSISHDVTVTNSAPTASFGSTSDYLTATLTSTSTDPDGTIASSTWDFGDGHIGTGESTTHTFAAAGTYNVTLTVTDNDGATSSISHDVTVVDPPPNVAPTGAFSFSSQFLTATVVGTGSFDSDGSIASYAWTFGDGGTGAGETAQHSYAAAGTYPVTLTVTDDDGATGVISHDVTVVDPPPAYATDLFGRVISNGLGAADLGGAWTLSGAATSFSVADGAGRVAGTVAANRAGYLTSVHQTDFDIKADLALDRAATGGGAYVSIIGRRISNGNDYRLKLRYLSDGSVVAYLTRTLGGVESIPASTTVPGLTVSPGDVLRTRFQVLGSNPTTIKAKVWRQGSAEPQDWLLSTTDVTPAALEAAGDVGVLLYVSGSWVGPAPVLSIDNFEAGPDSGAPMNASPAAAFSSSANELTATFTSTSTDSDGTIAAASWDFGDSSPLGSGDSVQHAYANDGTYTVTLTVTDDQGATATISHDITVTAGPPPANVAPAAAFTSSVDELTATLTSTSTDPDGTIAAASWDFGDSSPLGSGDSVQHAYADDGTYTVTLTVTDDDGATDTVQHDVTVAATPPPADLATDLFGRTISNGLGSADLGGAWTLSGAATSFSVDNGVAKIVGAVAANRAGYLAGVRQADADITADVSLDTASTGGGVYVSVVGRRVSNGNDYRLKLRYMPNGTVTVFLVRTLGGVETILSTTEVAGLTVSPADVLSVRFQVSGSSTTTAQAKVWRAGAPEPATWLASSVDATPAVLQAAGDIGVLVYTSGSWVGAPATLTLDNLHVRPLPAG